MPHVTCEIVFFWVVFYLNLALKISHIYIYIYSTHKQTTIVE